MRISEMLLPEFDEEMKKTRQMLERVPEGNPKYRPHEKSMPLGRLAGHVAQLGEFGQRIAELPSLDFSTSSMRPLVMESRQQLLDAFDKIVVDARRAIAGVDEAAWEQPWKLSFQGATIVEAPRLQVYRGLFLNHLVHHRAQLGVYLRLNNVPLPPLYGPTADDSGGFA